MKKCMSSIQHSVWHTVSFVKTAHYFIDINEKRTLMLILIPRRIVGRKEIIYLETFKTSEHNLWPHLG